ncbi:MAG: ornithine cyclodeaminase family protein [Bacteroidota bacterium]|nr:ornithine cyclodeaminase family protein [Bacteroidota bacterium]
MRSGCTLLLTRQDVISVLTLEECIAAVENAFRLYAGGKTLPPKILGLHSHQGGFHIKAGIMELGTNYFVAKVNSNFPANRAQHDLPLIQGIIIVCDADNGQLAALIDSIEITIVRTGAATAVAAKYLSRANSKTATICGCGNQGKVSLRALMKVRNLETVYAFDMDEERAGLFANELSKESGINVIAVNDLAKATRQSDICVTCTPSREPFLRPEYIQAGTFIAAVGADSEDKQELCTELLATSKIVVDLAEQCEKIGELHHALKAGQVQLTDVYAELGEIIVGQKKGRTADEEVIIFDSTGMALQDVAAAAIVYEKALERGIGIKLNFNEEKKSDAGMERLKKNQEAIAALTRFFPFR